MEVKVHDGPVGDITFMQDYSNQACLMISGGAGDCRVYVTDCETGIAISALSGHTGISLST